MTDEVKRGPGRPPKVSPEAKSNIEFVVEPAEAKAAEVLATTPEARASVPEVKPRLIEVQVRRKYVPLGQDDIEIKQSVPPGTVLEVPAAEAARLLKEGFAFATPRTFDL
jgi:hypothetical protein